MPNQLIQGSNCCSCATPDSVTFVSNTIVQGPQLYSGEGAPTNPPDNPTYNAQYVDILTSEEYYWQIATQTWVQEAGGGGGGGAQQVYHGNGVPAVTPDNPALPAIYYDDANGGLTYLWNTANQSWY